MKLNLLYHILILITIYCPFGQAHMNGDCLNNDDFNYTYVSVKEGTPYMFEAPESKCVEFTILNEQHFDVNLGSMTERHIFKQTVSAYFGTKNVLRMLERGVYDWALNNTVIRTSESGCMNPLARTKYWMTWNDNRLRIGRGSGNKPILSYDYYITSPNIDITHLQFKMLRRRGTGFFTFSKFGYCPDAQSKIELNIPTISNDDNDDDNVVPVELGKNSFYIRNVSETKCLQFTTIMPKPCLSVDFGEINHKILGVSYKEKFFNSKLRADLGCGRGKKLNRIFDGAVDNYVTETQDAFRSNTTDSKEYRMTWIDNVWRIDRVNEILPFRLQYDYNKSFPYTALTHMVFSLSEKAEFGYLEILKFTNCEKMENEHVH